MTEPIQRYSQPVYDENVGNYASPMSAPDASVNSDPYAIPWTQEREKRKRLQDAKIMRDNYEHTFVGMPTTQEVVKLGEYDDEIKRLAQQLGVGDRTSVGNVAAPMSAPETQSVPTMTEPIQRYSQPENGSKNDGSEYISFNDDGLTMEDIEAAKAEAAYNDAQIAPYTAGPMIDDVKPQYTPGPSTGSNNPPYTPGPRWEDESFPYERDIEVKAVVFYEPDGSKKDARDERKYLEEKGYVVSLVPMTNGLSFANEWNYMPESVGHVTVISHSHPWALTFNKSSHVGVSVKNSTFHTDDRRAKDDIYVEDLAPKDVSLRLMGCNTGHKDVPDNLAYAFSKIVSDDVYAADGNLNTGWLLYKANRGDT